MREIARNWWKANEKAISEGRWGDVKRGESYMDEKFYQMIAQIEAMAKAAEQPAAPETSPIIKKTRFPAKPIASTPAKSPPVQAPALAQTPAPTSDWLPWLLAATTLATAAGAVAIYRRKALRKDG